MDATTILEELRALGDETTKKTLMRHGAREPLFGVKVGSLKPLQKRIKTNYPLALELYETGVSDAMYLAGLVTDDTLMTRDDLEKWVRSAYWSMLCENTVPWVAAGNTLGWQLATEWIESDVETIARAGWATFSSLVAVTPDEQLNQPELERLLSRVENDIHQEKNGVRSTMNGFVICLGGYVAPMTELVLGAADRIGKVAVDKGNTACKTVSAREYIEKMQVRGVIGKKRRSAKC